jgi:hypothetical protein
MSSIFDVKQMDSGDEENELAGVPLSIAGSPSGRTLITVCPNGVKNKKSKTTDKVRLNN